jgi:hypothetical protein
VSVDFEPVRVGGRRPTVDPFAVGAVAVVIALAVAVVKPWESSAGGASPSPALRLVAAPSTAAESPASARLRAVPAAPVATPGLSQPTWPDIKAVVAGHPTWGVIAVVGHTSRFTVEWGVAIDYSSLWRSGVPGNGDDAPIDIRPDTLTTLALGLTFPPGDAPDEVRIFQMRRGGELEWIDAATIPRPGPDDPLLLTRSESTTTIGPWQPGRYRIDLVRPDRIDGFTVDIADPFGVVPPPAAG